VETKANPPDVPTSISTPLKVITDNLNKTRTDEVNATGTASATELNLGNVTVKTSDCELWRIGVKVLDDYHKVDLRSPPAKKLHIMRPGGVVVGTAYAFYDYIRVRSDYLSNQGDAFIRENTIFHEFAHTVRHVFDSPDNINHWNCDDFRWAYARNHCGNEIYNMHYAFNEGWSDYWASARHRGSALYNLVDYCGFAPLLTGNEDWVELYVANALINLENQLISTKNMTKVQAERQMLNVLRKNPRTIHSLYAFKAKLAAAVGWPPVPEPAKCPKDYTHDGLTCRKDVVVQAKPSYGRGVGTPPKSCKENEDYDAGLCYAECKSGYKGVGPVCWGKCEAGYHDDGATCRRDAHIFGKDSYGRGVGKPLPCRDGRERDAGLCYKKCRDGYKGVGPVCWRSCPQGYHSDGATCRKDVHIVKKASYGRGAGTPPKSCGLGKNYDAGLCYKTCKHDFHGVGPVCWGKCPKGFEDHGATCYIGTNIIVRGGSCNFEAWTWY